MASATQFFGYWALAFVTLGVAVVLLNFYYLLIDSELELHGWPKEAAIVVIASAVEAAGFWVSASLFHGNPGNRAASVIPLAVVALIYWIAHIESWSGYELGGIGFFQGAILGIAACLLQGEFKFAGIILGLFVLGLMIIASIAKSM